MTRQAIDFQGIASFERTLAEQLQNYLEERETYFSSLIAESIPTEPDPSQPILDSLGTPKKLSSGVEAFTRKVSQAVIAHSTTQNQWKDTVTSINNAMCKYADLLQQIAVELFQQLDLTGIEQWRTELLQVVENVKEILLHHMEDLKWALKRLESQLWEYKRSIVDQTKFMPWLSQLVPQWKSIVDSALIKNLEKSQKFLNFRYLTFLHRFELYNDLNDQVEVKMTKFSSYHVLATLETDEQESFKHLYRLLKLWKLNRNAKALPDAELSRVIRYSINPQKSASLFKNYFQALQKKLFTQSREIKRTDGKLDFNSDFDLQPSSEVISENETTMKQMELQGSITGQRFELHTLGATISAYRSFLLQSDPNPYVRTRGGFSEWIVGQEPSQTKSLMDQEYTIEKLDTLYLQFSESVKQPSLKGEINDINGLKILENRRQLFHELDLSIYEMGQPLASSSMMTSKAENFVNLLNQLNELGSRDPDVVSDITPLLSKVMRADWKYNVLQDIPLFHQLYSVHMNLLPPITDRNHINRLRQFKKHILQLTQWVKEKNMHTHLHEIEFDINDIKGYLQDFLAQLQRMARDPVYASHEGKVSLIQDTAQQLLEYRYMFCHFFHHLRQNEIDEKSLRNQFLFVDQYFETIENKLDEIVE